MIIENTEDLRDWLTKYLEPLCDADPIALAKYVMALIKKDKPEKDLKTVCLDQLEVFLQKETITFVDTLFETIANKSYIKPAISATVTTTSVVTPTPPLKPQTTEPTPIVQSERSSSPVVKAPDVGPNSSANNNNNNNLKSIEPHISSQSTNKTDSTHDTSLRVRDKRNRSRSRSPLRNQRRNEFDTRRLGPHPNRNNGSTYFNDDRRNRRGLPNRRVGGQRFSGYRNDRNERDYRRQRDLKRGRSRSRSRTFSSGSSRSRSRSRSRSWSRERGDRDSPNTKKSRPSSRPNSRSPSPTKTVPKDGEKSKKCRDYEEKGFCLKGHLCPYDHGNDPVVLDSNVSAALGFTNTGAANGPLMPIPNPGIPTNAPNSYLAEPYNPEAPGMDSQRPHPPQGPPPMGPRMPPPFWGPMGPIRGPLPPGPPLPPPQFMPPPGRPRELIGVPTIDNNHRHSHSNRTVIEPSMGHRGGMRGGHIKHMGRGGYRNVRRINNESADKTCLEVRKIPSNMNTISHLNQHFSKFGTIVNLQVCHEGDPEAALVQYTSHGEALSAIRSTEAVLNNRFIKVFWHSKELQQKHEQTFGVKQETTDDSDATGASKISIKDRLGPKIETESVLTAVNSSGTISRTVFDPSKLKKNNKNNKQIDNKNTETKNSQNISDKTNETISDVNTSPMSDKTNNKSIYSKQTKLLEEMRENQKQLLTKLSKSTNENEKKMIMDTIDMIGDKIKLIIENIKKQQSLKKSAKKPQTKEELMAEILNIDLDIYLKMQNKDMSYVELAAKYAKLKKMQRNFATRGRGGKSFPRRGRGLTRRGSFFGRGSNPLLKVDRRTRKLLIPDINEDDITDLLEHLAQFSDVDQIEPSSNGAVVTFKTRMDAEKAIQNIGQIKFKENCQLSYTWCDDNTPKSSDKMSLNKTISEPKAQNEGTVGEIETLGEEELLDYEEDDTEDESEARNWKA